MTVWGGEAIYCSHEENSEARSALRKIGTSCIVEAEIPIASLDTFLTVGERLVACFLHRRGVVTAHGPDFEGHVQEGVRANNIRRIITRNDTDFEWLTTCSTWHYQI